MFSLLCDFLIGVGLSSEVYVMRNHSSNVEWSKSFTLENMNRSMHSKTVWHYLPQQVPADHKRIKFSHFLEKYVLQYDAKPLNPRDDHRMLSTIYSPTYNIFGKLTDGHTCNHTGEPRYGRDYFIGTKGAGVNFHQHFEIYHHLISGRKMFLIADDYSVFDGILGPRDALAPKIEEILELDGVKKCIIGPGDMIHLPKHAIHGVFNLETSISSACVIHR